MKWPNRFQARLPASPVALAALVTLALVASPAVAAGQVDVVQRWPEAAAALERAALDEDVETLRAIREACVQALAATPPPADDRAQLLRYAVAYAGWRMAFHPDVPAAEQDAGLSAGVSALTTLLKTKDGWAEPHGLLGTIYGVQIGKSPMKGVFLGPRAGRAIDRAAQLEPDNPRVAVHRGIGKFFTPALFGGSLSEAETQLRRAIDLFAREPADKPWPNWGRFDAHVWLGQVLLKRNDAAGARAEYARALALAPRSRWVRDVLLPAAQASNGRH